MNRILTIGVISAALSACVSTEDPSSSSSVASSQVVQSSSSVQVSSSVMSSTSSVMSSNSIAVISSSSSVTPSSSSVASSSSQAAFDGDIARGKAEIKDSGGPCFICHQDPNEDGLFDQGLSGITFDVNNFAYQAMAKFQGKGYTGATKEDLAKFILQEMIGSTGVNLEQRSEDMAAYLWSLRGQQVVVGPTECTSDDPVMYGRRSLKFLTSYEYHNSLQSLFGAPLPADYSSSSKILGDTSVGGLPNHGFAAINESRTNSYDSNAKEIAEWAIETQGALPFSCTQAAVCADDFVEKFAYYAFRRPLSEEEKSEYAAIIAEAPSIEAGLKWAIRAALISPQFLYRSELGETAAATLDAINNAPEVVIYEPASDPVSILNTSPANAGYKFTGNDLILLTVTATPMLDYSVFPAAETNTFPAIRITGNGFNSEPIPVRSRGPITLKFHVTELMGDVYYLAHQGVGDINGVQYGGGYEVVEFAVAEAQVKETPEDFKLKVSAADPSAYVLDDFEYASAIAFMLTGSAPDKELMHSALTGDINDPAILTAHIDRLIDSDLGREQVARFAGLWFKTDDVVKVNRFGNDQFTQTVKNAMAEEIREMYKHAFFDESVPYKALFDAEFTFLNKTLSDFYGIPGASTDEFVKVSTAGTKRGGLIASGAFMTLYAHDNRTSPIKRSVHVRQDFLCQSIPQPGALDDGDERVAAAALAEAREKEGDLTTTEFYEIQTNVPGTSCATCHNAVINPLFAIDDFNNVGLPRKEVNGLVVQKGLGESGQADVPIDQVNDGGYLYSGEVVGALNTSIADEAKAQGNGIYFKGAKELSKALVANDLPGVDACLVQKTYRYALGAPVSSADVDARFEAPLSAEETGHMLCVMEELTNALGSANSPRAMLKALVLSDVIRFRR